MSLGHSAFAQELAARQTNPEGRSWLFVSYDQLTDRLGPLATEDPDTLGIIIVESTWKARRRPYHVQKLALILANLRQFALEQAARGVAVRHVVTDTDYGTALAPLIETLGPLRCMAPAERELRIDLEPLVQSDAIRLLPNEGWLTTREHFDASNPAEGPWRMDRFYPSARQRAS